MSYKDYLSSHHWKQTRQVTLDNNPRCEICDNENNLNVHHKRYTDKNGSVLTKEKQHYLVTLCSSCHKTWHNFYQTKILGTKIYHIARKLFRLGLDRTDSINMAGNYGLIKHLFHMKKQLEKNRITDKEVSTYKRRLSVRSRTQAGRQLIG